MESKPCPFCGSKTPRRESPYVDAFGKKETTFCCKAQAINNKYAARHRDADTLEKPNLEEVAKW